MAFRPKLVPTLITVPALITLLILGGWQIQRLFWKEALLDKLQERSVAEAVTLPTGDLDAEAWEYKKVEAVGRFLHDDEVHLLNRSLRGNPGLHILTPFKRSDVEGGPVVLVNRGWVPFDQKEQATRKAGLLDGEVKVQGILRFPREVTSLQRVFLPENEPARNMWYNADLARIEQVKGHDMPNYYLMDGREEVPGLYPVGRQWRLDIRNDHLQYAITWFILAIALAVIYGLYHRPSQEGASDDQGMGDTRS